MYECINGWTKKKIINKIQKEFKGKSFESRSRGGNICLYRGPNGKKCAFGLFIPDNLFDPFHNSSTAITIIDAIPELEDIIPFELQGIEEFQLCHDAIDVKKVTTVSAQKKILTDWVKKNVK